MTRDGDTAMGGLSRRFPTTVWSDILAAQTDGEKQKDLLRDLLMRYWKPIYYCIRRGGESNEDAKDFTQDFIVHMIENEILTRIGPGQAKFRTYLKSALKNFLVDRSRRKSTAKRGGRAAHLSLDFNGAQTEIPFASSTLSPDQVFDRVWAESIRQQCLAQLKEHLIRSEKEVYWHVFSAYDLQADGADPITYASLARRLDISESDVRNYLSYVRNLLYQLVLRCVQDSLAAGEDAEEEMRELFGPASF